MQINCPDHRPEYQLVCETCGYRKPDGRVDRLEAVYQAAKAVVWEIDNRGVSVRLNGLLDTLRQAIKEVEDA